MATTSGSMLRGIAASVLCAALAGPLLRLSLGRWPTAEETGSFRDGVQGRASDAPALLRGLLAVHATGSQLLRPPGPRPPRPTRPVTQPQQPARRGIAVVHIEKTAGTSLAHYLRRALPGAPDPDATGGLPAHLFSPIFIDPAPPVLRAHFALRAARRAGPDRFVLTLLRDPRQRVL